jgi:hypothetical protein
LSYPIQERCLPQWTFTLHPSGADLKTKKASAHAAEAFFETILAGRLFFGLAAATTAGTGRFLLFFDHALAATAIRAFFGLASGFFGCPAFFTFEYRHCVASSSLVTDY